MEFAVKLIDNLLIAALLSLCFASQFQLTGGESIVPGDTFHQVASEPLYTNHYQSASGQKLRVNVSNICEKNQMRVTIRMNRPFYGLIHAKDKRRKPNCFLEGTGDQTYTIDIYYTQVQTDPYYCGVVSHQLKNSAPQQPLTSSNQTTANEQQTLSVILVVRLHRSIEFSDDRFFLLSCANRCQRSDCSLPTSSSTNAQLISSSVQRGSVSSDPIILLPSVQDRATFNQAKQVVSQCDTLLELKYRWLIRLCWLLTTILAIMCFLSICLCFSLRNARQSAAQTKTIHSSMRTRSTQKPKQLIYDTGKSSNTTENSSWSAATTTTSEDYNTDSTAYLVKQQKQLVDNLEIPLNRVQPVIGRMAGAFGASAGQVCTPQHQAQVRRRRSIGALSQRVPVEFRLTEPHDNYGAQLGNRLTASQRAKSRSQTIIHYNQEQDPYKAIPFKSMNTNDYLVCNQANMLSSTNLTAQQSLNKLQATNYDQQNRMIAAQYDENGNQQQNFTNYEVQDKPSDSMNSWSTLPTNTYFATTNPQTTVQWPNTLRNSSTFLPSSANDITSNRGQIINQQMLSQFDPNNSRQLINLIQQKHRQQILQANITAASLQSSTSEKEQYPNQYLEQRIGGI